MSLIKFFFFYLLNDKKVRKSLYILNFKTSFFSSQKMVILTCADYDKCI